MYIKKYLERKHQQREKISTERKHQQRERKYQEREKISTERENIKRENRKYKLWKQFRMI